MKVAAVLVTIVGVASAFAPQSAGRSSTQLQESLADKVCVSRYGCCGIAAFVRWVAAVTDRWGLYSHLFLFCSTRVDLRYGPFRAKP